MHPVEIAYFALTLFLALTGLMKWKIRKDALAARLNRGLKGYVDRRGSGRFAPHRADADDQDLIVA